MGQPKLILRTVNKNLKGLEKRCQSLVTVTYIKRKKDPPELLGGGGG
jgi:hypothetical protein